MEVTHSRLVLYDFSLELAAARFLPGVDERRHPSRGGGNEALRTVLAQEDFPAGNRRFLHDRLPDMGMWLTFSCHSFCLHHWSGLQRAPLRLPAASVHEAP